MPQAVPAAGSRARGGRTLVAAILLLLCALQLACLLRAPAAWMPARVTVDAVGEAVLSAAEADAYLQRNLHLLDRRNDLIIVSGFPVYPREVVKRALQYNAAAVIIGLGVV